MAALRVVVGTGVSDSIIRNMDPDLLVKCS